MKKDSNFSNNIAFGQEITTAERGHAFSKVVFLLCLGLNYLVFLHSFHRSDYIETNKSGGQQQSNLFPVSAGNDLRMSTMRPNPYLSTGIVERRDKKRGLLPLFSRPF